MPEEYAPPVVAVVVTSVPGAWFELCLESLRSQDYPNLAVLVVDDGSEIPVAERVAAILPEAVVRRRDVAAGFAAAANEALSGVEGSTYFLFCHDDVVLERGVVGRLVEEAFRSNAAVAGPKLVDAAAPDRLLQVGLGMHRHGTAAPRVQPGELDQSQHDEAREVFAVPGACTLIRTDLFEALGGFDDAMTMFGEDVDFSWRAQVAGARVVVVPQAVVGHRQTSVSGERPVAGGAALRRRHELRAALKNYGWPRRPVVVAELVLFGLAELLIALASGDRPRARRLVHAWRWNLANRASLRVGRRRLHEVRQVGDRAMLLRMAHRGRAQRYLRPEQSAVPERWLTQSGGLEDVLAVGRRGSWWSRVQRGDVPAAQLSLTAAVAVLGLIGVRGLLFARLPLVGQLVPMGNGTSLLGHYFGGRTAQFGGTEAAPTAYGIVGLVALVLGNSSALAWKLIALGSLAVGAVGVSRLCRPFLSSRGRLTAAAAFVALPLTWNVLAAGNVQAAVTLGLMPYVLGRLARASGLPPFEPGGPGAVDGAAGTGRLRSLVGEIMPFGLLLAVQTALAPASLLATGVLAATVMVGTLLSGSLRAPLRVLIVSLGAGAVAALACLPWAVTWLSTGARWSAFSGAVASSTVGPADLLRGHLGPVGSFVGAWGLVVAAGYVLLVARRERLSWAMVLWLSALGSVALAWVGARGWIGSGGGATMILLAPAGVALAVACGLGVSAFERDVASAQFGWRQMSGLLAAMCLVVGFLPGLRAVIGGRADLPSQGFDQTLDWTAPSAGQSYRVLWLGDPRTLPASGWQIQRGLAWYTTATGLPSGDQVWPSARLGAAGSVAEEISAAEAGKTASLGALLAARGIRYLVVPTTPAPVLPGTQVPSTYLPPNRLVTALESQADLAERPEEGGTLVFENAAWKPGAATTTPPPTKPTGLGSPLDRGVELGLSLAVILLGLAEGVRRRRRRDRRELAVPPAPRDRPTGTAGEPSGTADTDRMRSETGDGTPVSDAPGVTDEPDPVGAP